MKTSNNLGYIAAIVMTGVMSACNTNVSGCGGINTGTINPTSTHSQPAPYVQPQQPYQAPTQSQPAPAQSQPAQSNLPSQAYIDSLKAVGANERSKEMDSKFDDVNDRINSIADRVNNPNEGNQPTSGGIFVLGINTGRGGNPYRYSNGHGHNGSRFGGMPSDGYRIRKTMRDMRGF